MRKELSKRRQCFCISAIVLYLLLNSLCTESKTQEVQYSRLQNVQIFTIEDKECSIKPTR